MLQQVRTVYYNPHFRITDSKSARNDGIVTIQGQVSSEEERSQKGYRYISGFWEKVLRNPDTQELIKNKQMLGQIEHPADSEGDWNYLSTPYDKASHVVTRAWIDPSNNPWASFALLNNEHGCNVKALLEVGHNPGVSTRGMGEIKSDSLGEFVDDTGYSLISWDIVRSPNFPSLRLKQLSDSIEFKELAQAIQLRDSGKESFNKEVLLKEIEHLAAEIKRIQTIITLIR